MKKHLSALVVFAFSLIGCNLSNGYESASSPNYSLSMTGGPTGTTFSGDPFILNAEVKLLMNAAPANASGAVTFELHKNSSCTLPASGTLGGITLTSNMTAGAISLAANPTYTESADEISLYLKATYTPKGLSRCSTSSMTLLQHMGASGFVNYLNGGAGAAGAAVGSKWDTPTSMVQDSERRLLIAGASLNTVGRYEIVLWRYKGNGTLDTTFGVGGVNIVNPGGAGLAGALVANKLDFPASPRGMVLTSSNKILLAARSRNAAGGHELALLRMNNDGSPDSAFGNGGITLFQPGGTGAAGALNAVKVDSPAQLIIDSAGKIVVVGKSLNAAGGIEPAVWRFTANGALDTTFGGTGFILFGHNAASLSGALNNTKVDWASSVVEGTSSSYVVGGAVAGPPSLTTFWAIENDGDPLTTFGALGTLVINNAGASLNGAAFMTREDASLDLIRTGNGFAAATYSMNGAGELQPVVVKFDATGTLDTTFNSTNGFKILDNGVNGLGGGAIDDVPFSINEATSGKLVVTTSTPNAAGGREIAIARLTAAGAYDTTLNTTGWFRYGQAGLVSAGGAANASKMDAYTSPVVDGVTIQTNKVPMVVDHAGRYVISFPTDTASGTTFQLNLQRFMDDGLLDQ